MTYIEGEDLLHILKREQTVPVPEALRILRPVVSGLVAAHEAGVVHRDLKPANIMVEPSTGESYIMDFGIARSATPTGADVAEDLVAAKTKKRMGVTEETQAGAVVGTLQYMAPEQFCRQGHRPAGGHLFPRPDLLRSAGRSAPRRTRRKRVQRVSRPGRRRAAGDPDHRSVDSRSRSTASSRAAWSPTRRSATPPPPSSRPSSTVSTTRATRCR